MISFIIPAHDEERLVGATLDALQLAARSLAQPCEILVVDDASTDRTAAIAIGHGARVVSIAHRHIAATRNAGARDAIGEILVFVDADTLATQRGIDDDTGEDDAGYAVRARASLPARCRNVGS